MKQKNNHFGRRLLTMLTALALTASLTACGSAAGDDASGENAETAKETVEEEQTIVPAEDATVQNENAADEETSEETEPVLEPAGNYSLVQNVYNWGSSYSRAILPIGTEETDYAEAEDYTVSVWRYDVNGDELDHGERTVVSAYLSDEEGNETADGAYVTLEMEMAPAVGLYTPYYTNPDSFQGQLKSWADCSYTFTNTATGEIWNQLDAVYHPDEEAFGTGVFSGAEYKIPYAFYAPDADGEAHPLVIWLHGAGSGGTDIGFVTGGMLVTNFISDEVQEIFGGAHILLPQCETWWLDDDSESHYSSDGSSIYVESLKAMIDDYVSNHGDVDTSRIYVGGCSNGGFMTIAMNLAYPDYFAASFPVCEAYEDAWISDEEIETLKNIPTWFVHCSNDPVVDVTATSVPTYERLVAAGAENVHYTTYEQIIDPDYGNEYGGHFAWVYALGNLCSTDYDGSLVTVDGEEVTLFQWLAAQSK